MRQHAPAEGEALTQPAALQGQDVDALFGGVDHPVVAEVEALVINRPFRNLAVVAGAAEEEQIARAQLRDAQPRALGDFTGLGGRGATPDRFAPRQPRELVDAPDEARAVKAAVRKAIFGAIGRAAPDVGVAD